MKPSAVDLLRESIETFRLTSEKAAAFHAELARDLVRDGVPEDMRVAIRALASVQDCLSRRARQWAASLEVAVLEIDELTGG